MALNADIYEQVLSWVSWRKKKDWRQKNGLVLVTGVDKTGAGLMAGVQNGYQLILIRVELIYSTW
jgi:hypothetical protein